LRFTATAVVVWTSGQSDGKAVVGICIKSINSFNRIDGDGLISEGIDSGQRLNVVLTRCRESQARSRSIQVDGV